MRVVGQTPSELWGAEVVYPEVKVDLYRGYRPPDHRFDVAKYAGKVQTICEALRDYDGIAVYSEYQPTKKIPKRLIVKQVAECYIAHFGRTGYYTDTGFIVFNCGHIQHRQFLDTWADWFESGRFKKGPQFHDGLGFDAALKWTGVPANNLSGEHHKVKHPLKHTELGRWFA